MVPELGALSLSLALVAAGVQSLALAPKLRPSFLIKTKRAAQIQASAIAVAMGVLIYSFAISDFSVAIIADHSHSAKPFLYKIAAAWGQHEGSLLLWILVLALFGAAMARHSDAVSQRALGVQGLIGVCFLSFALFTSNPFSRLLPAPSEGAGLNPLLQHPALALHPPVLYLGYVGLSVMFAYAIAGMLEKSIDSNWAARARPYASFAWATLTAGIALGSWWAYNELGWGGFWFWDPVENASFMPWLAATALVHSLAVLEKRGLFVKWTLLLSILAFVLSLVGTFIVRSGVLISVHAFATDPERGLYLLGFIAAAATIGFLLFALQPQAPPKPRLQYLSREAAIVINNLLLMVACFTVFFGTLYPLFLDALGGGIVSVGPPYFENSFTPIALVLLPLAGAAPLLAWRKTKQRPPYLLPALLAGFVLAILASMLAGQFLIAFVLGGWIITATVTATLNGGGRQTSQTKTLSAKLTRLRKKPVRFYAVTLAHVGLGVFVCGAAAASLLEKEYNFALAEGEHIELDGGPENGGYRIELSTISVHQGPNFVAQRATLYLDRPERAALTLTPERRFYPAAQQDTAEADVHARLGGDIYAVLGTAQPVGEDGIERIAIRFYIKPLMAWIWSGTALMTLGGALALLGTRRRKPSARLIEESA